MIKKNIVFLLFILTVVEIQGEIAINRKTKVVMTCDDFQNIADFNNSKEVERVQNHIFYSLWNMTLPKRTALSDELKCILEDMAMKSKVPFWRKYALATTEWIFTYLPALADVPHLCSYAAIINATVQHMKDKNCPVILNAIQGLLVAIKEASYLLTENGIKFAGCEHCVRPVKLSGASCPHKGLVYDLEEIWSLVGWKYPCQLINVIKKSYYSRDSYDRVNALIGTAFLSEPFSDMESEYKPELLYKLFVMYTNGKIERYCCDDFVHEARELSDKIQEFNDKNLCSIGKKSTGCIGY